MTPQQTTSAPHGTGQGQLNVETGDLHHAADQYLQLQAAATVIGPQAVAEVQRIIDSHGAMGYPVAVGVLTNLARREVALAKKTTDFGVYAERFNEHAATYLDQDQAGARDISNVQFVSAKTGASGQWDSDWWNDPDEFWPEPIDMGGAAAGPGAGPAIPPGLIGR